MICELSPLINPDNLLILHKGRCQVLICELSPLINPDNLLILHRYSGRTLKEIGGHFQIGESGVTKASQRFHELLKNDEEIREKVEYICKSLRLSNA